MQAYRAARVVDGISEGPLENGMVLVEAGRVVSVERDRAVPAGVEVIDLGEATLLPGLIDAHVHLVWNASREPHVLVEQESRHLTVLRCAANCGLHLRAGVTTIRDNGSTDAIALAVARATELHLIPGPRIVAAGRVICMTGGHANVLGREADGPDAVRQAVRSEMKGGAHLIKLMASGGIYGHGEEVGSPQYTVEELRAGVEEAHKAGRKTSAHAYSPQAIANALEAGIDSVEHASFLDRETAVCMRKQGTYMVPTLSTYQAMHDRAPELGSPDYILRKTTEVMLASRTAFQLALQTGVLIAAGTDGGAPGHPHGSLAEELRLMVGLGATPMQAIRFGTAASADLLGVAADVGTIEPGKRADLLAVNGDPTQDICRLRDVRLVVRDGAVAWSQPQFEAVAAL
jgi:imidazolonepropionase-like amidohydrolase